MAQLPPEITELTNQLRQQSLEIVHAGTAVAFNLNEQIGETDETLPFFDELQSAVEDARSTLSRLHHLQLMIAESQPIVPLEALQLLSDSTEYTINRIPAWERSIEEVKVEFNL
jgi:hypothetical protein